MIGFIWSDLKNMPIASLTIVFLMAFASGSIVFITLAERSLQLSSARAADPFEIVIGAAGSPTQLLLSTVFLHKGSLPLISHSVLDELNQNPNILFAAPLGFGDAYLDYPIIGTDLSFIKNFYPKLQKGRYFQNINEAIIGARVPLALDQMIQPIHPSPIPGGHSPHPISYKIVGQVGVTNTVWDRAILVSMKTIWHLHPQEVAQTQDHHPISAIIVKAKTIADSYKIRNKYRTNSLLAIFPGEVLSNLYELLGNVRYVFSFTANIISFIIIFIIAFISILHIQSKKQQIFILRLLGISRFKILMIIWLEFFLLLLSGVIASFFIILTLYWIVSNYSLQTSGIIMVIEFQPEDWQKLGWILLLIALESMIPALFFWRQNSQNTHLH